MDSDDMIFNKTGGKVTALGWTVNSQLLQNDFPLSAHCQSGGGSAIQGLAVPAGLILLQNMIDSNTNMSSLLEAPKVIGHNLYDKLLTLAGRKKRMLRDSRKKIKKKGGKKNKTRKK
jgi:hypothetical protein